MTRVVAASVAVWLAASASAAADTYRPTRFDDPAAAKCKPSNCSLRGAVGAANDHRGKDKVLLDGGTYELTLAETPANDNAGGDLDVKGEVRIRGAGASATTVDANGGSRVFSLLKDAPKSIERLTVTGGTPTPEAESSSHRLKRTSRRETTRCETSSSFRTPRRRTGAACTPARTR